MRVIYAAEFEFESGAASICRCEVLLETQTEFQLRKIETVLGALSVSKNVKKEWFKWFDSERAALEWAEAEYRTYADEMRNEAKRADDEAARIKSVIAAM